MGSLAVFVKGRPRPQGSMTIGYTGDGKPFIRHSSDAKLKSWRRDIGYSVRGAPTWEGKVSGPVGVWMRFLIPKPKTNEDPYPMVSRGPAAGDLDKYERAVLDALTGPLLDDDAVVVRITSGKFWATERTGPGLSLAVYWGDHLMTDHGP